MSPEGSLFLLTVSFLLPLGIFLLTIRPYLRYLVKKGLVVDDMHKSPPTKVPSPTGPLIFLALFVGELTVFLVSGSLVPIALLGSTLVAFLVGVADDTSVLGPKTKPLLLLLSGVPMLVGVLVSPDLYEPSITFPIFGSTSEHFTTYTLLVFLAFPVVANAFNMVDSFNGEISGFSTLTSAALVFAIALKLVSTGGGGWDRVAAALPLVAVSVGFYLFNRYPSKAFDGNSGSLAFGALYAGLAITGGVEIVAAVAILPAILNSYYILSSVKGLVERRKMGRPTYMGEDRLLHASTDSSAPSTLVRMILLDGPLAEQSIVGAVLKLTLATCLLSAVTSMLTWGY